MKVWTASAIYNLVLFIYVFVDHINSSFYVFLDHLCDWTDLLLWPGLVQLLP